eukprot:jgi/Picsp_1/5548/NSC_02907-R1_protein
MRNLMLKVPNLRRFLFYGLLVTILLIAIATKFLPEQQGLENRREENKEDQKELNELFREPSQAYCRMGIDNTVAVCAHGGDHGQGKFSNTKSSLESAIEAGSPCLEVDASITKDGHLVALHDRDLRTIMLHNGMLRENEQPTVSHIDSGLVDKLTWPSGDKVLDLSTALQIGINNSVDIIVDIKPPREIANGDPGYPTIDFMIKKVVQTLRKVGCGDKCLIWGKSDDLIIRFRRLDASLRLGIVAKNETKEDISLGYDRVDRLPEENISVIAMHHAMLASAQTDHISEANRLGRSVRVWTADAPWMMSNALNSLPEAIVTSKPRLLLQAIQERRIACEYRVEKNPKSN